MLFRYTETESPKAVTPQDAVIVRKGSFLRAVLYALSSVLLIAAGVLCMLFEPIPQYLTVSLCLFIASLVPVFYLLDFFMFRLTIGKGKLVLKKILAKETVYPFTEVSWKLQSPDKKRSAILLYAKSKPVARILPGAKNYAAVLSLRHKGTLEGGEKELLRKISENSDK